MTLAARAAIFASLVLFLFTLGRYLWLRREIRKLREQETRLLHELEELRR